MLLSFTALFFTGCAPAGVSVDVDADGDGLLGSEEAELGTDPASPDSDEDGVDDGTELSANTNPLDGGEYPYKGGWSIGSCHADIQGEGRSVDQVSSDFSMSDQYGQQVHLYSFCDRVVYLIFSAEWCGVCQAEAAEMEAFYKDNQPDLMVVEAMIEDNDGNPPDVALTQRWAEAYGLTIPVLVDTDQLVYEYAAGEGGSIGLPYTVVLDRGMVITDEQSGPNSEAAADLL